jgi:4-hydroxybutyrate dehydrogenase
LSLPRFLTAGTGIDALSHCLEGYLSSAVNPPADAVALDGVERLMRHLPRAVRDGSDREARWNVMMGAIEGGMSILRGLGPAHALSIPLDAYDLHHGTLVGVLLPYSVEFVAESVPEARMHRLTRAMGCERASEIPARLRALNREIGLPADLAEMNLTEAVMPSVATLAAHSFFNQSSSRRGTAEDYLALALDALHAVP